jgi:hypothetical protein
VLGPTTSHLTLTIILLASETHQANTRDCLRDIDSQFVASLMAYGRSVPEQNGDGAEASQYSDSVNFIYDAQ